jgi:hypothetical protein
MIRPSLLSVRFGFKAHEKKYQCLGVLGSKRGLVRDHVEYNLDDWPTGYDGLAHFGDDTMSLGRGVTFEF